MKISNPIAQTAHWLDQMLLKARQQQHRAGTPMVLTCTKGCAACCQELVHVSELEARWIVDEMTDAEKEELKPKVAAWLEAFQNHHTGTEPDGLEYRSWGLPCPLLKGNLCSVYARRPLSCRSFLTCGPRAACEDMARRPRQKFIQIPELDKAVAASIVGAHRKAGHEVMGFAHLGLYLAELLGLHEAEHLLLETLEDAHAAYPKYHDAKNE